MASLIFLFLFFSFSSAAKDLLTLPPSQPPSELPSDQLLSQPPLQPPSEPPSQQLSEPPLQPPHADEATVAKIQQACKATRYPDSCQASLTGKVPPGATTIQIIQAATSISTAELDAAQTMISDILSRSAGDANLTTAATNCVELLKFSEYRLDTTDTDFLPSGRIKDARAWTSAALTFQYDCWSAFKYANDTAEVGRTMAFLNESLVNHTSNALAMMVAYDRHGDDTGAWTPPLTEREGLFEVVGTEIEFADVVEEKIEATVTVCQIGGGDCDYRTIQDAVNAAPDNNTTGRFVILIKTGTYEENVRVPLHKVNVVFLGEGMGKTVITGSLHAGMPGISTYNTATVGVQGDGFKAKGVTFQNMAQPELESRQAVAFRSDSDHCVIRECEFIGNQDTLYVHTLRQFYKSCRIQGNVDFIFGNSASVFHDCVILLCPRQIEPEKGEKNAVAAHGRIDPSQSSGFVFQNCIINGTEKYVELYNSNPEVHLNFLARPWKPYSRTVYIHCELGALVSPDGWMPWTGDLGLNTLYFGEFENKGPGSDTSKRVAWSNRIPAENIASYSVKNFIQGDEWIPPKLG